MQGLFVHRSFHGRLSPLSLRLGKLTLYFQSRCRLSLAPGEKERPSMITHSPSLSVTLPVYSSELLIFYTPPNNYGFARPRGEGRLRFAFPARPLISILSSTGNSFHLICFHRSQPGASACEHTGSKNQHTPFLSSPSNCRFLKKAAGDVPQKLTRPQAPPSQCLLLATLWFFDSGEGKEDKKYNERLSHSRHRVGSGR